MEQLALKVFKSKYFVRPTIILSIITICILARFVTIKDKIIFPNLENFKYEYYTDKPNGGNSQILEHFISDSAIKFKFLLKDGFYSPYVGLSITPLANASINAGKFNRLSINILGRNIDRIGIALYTPPLSYNIENRNQDETLYHSYLNISNRKKTYNVSIEQFQHPEWWKDLHHIPETKKNTPDLNNILHINIGSAFSPTIDEQKTLEIYSIALTRNNQKLFLMLGLIYGILVLLIFGILYWGTFIKDNSVKITISYRPLEITKRVTGEEKCIEYINNYYNNSDLTLEKISKEAAITPRRITNIIHDKFNCNFKTYLNRIRINESKRFLTQTDLNIGEIAYRVGFNTQSHFNRVFKSEIHISPSEYRDQYKS